MWAGGADADAVIAEARASSRSPIRRRSSGHRCGASRRSPGQLADYRAGKDKLFGFFVGQVMKATGGKANPAQLNELLQEEACRLRGSRGASGY